MGPVGPPGAGAGAGAAGGAAATGGGARRAILGVLGVVVVAGLAAVAYLAYTALHGKGDALTKLVPANADVYGTFYFNPSASQKQNLDTLFKKFPVSGGQTSEQFIESKLNDALKSSHMSFTGDIKPWLGDQIGFALRVPQDSSGGAGTPEAIILAQSTNDSAAQAFLDKAKSNASGDTWTTENHNGVTVTIGTPQGGSKPDTAYAYVDHTVVAGGSVKLVEDAIDTDKGGANLGDSSEYKRTLNNVPDDRIALVYANTGQLLDRFGGQLAKSSTSCLPQQVSGLRGAVVTVSAQSQGIALDSNVDVDQSRLQGAARNGLGDNHQSTTLDYMPGNSYGALALTHVNDTLSTALNQCVTDPSVRDQLQSLGLTGNGGVVAHMTGDVGLTVGPGSQYPTGALLIGTNDASGMKGFLDKIANLAGQFANNGLGGGGFGSSGSSFGSTGGALGAPPTDSAGNPLPTDSAGNPLPTDSAGNPLPTDSAGNPLPTDSAGNPVPTDSSGNPVQTSPPVASPQSSTYNGVQITSVPISSLEPLGFAPSYAVFDNMAVLAASPDEVKAIIDAHRNHSALTSNGTFTNAKNQLPGGDAVNFYLDLTAIESQISRLPVPVDTSQVRPVKQVISGGQSGSDHVSGRFFVVIQ